MGVLAALLLAALSVASAGDGGRHDVRLDASPDPMAGVPVVDELEAGDVLVVHVTDGEPGGEALVRQCDRLVDGFIGCRNTFPVLFDDDGVARFQYQLVEPGSCGQSRPCTLVIAERGGEVTAWAFLVFGGSAPPPPTVALSPPGPYEPGQAVDVAVSGLLPGTEVDVAVCGTPCGRVVSATADGDGNATVTVRPPASCKDCHVVALAGVSRATVRVPLARVAVGYDPARLVAGLAAAAALLILAWRIVAGVDWSPPSEAATPELDAADPRSVV